MSGKHGCELEDGEFVPSGNEDEKEEPSDVGASTARKPPSPCDSTPRYEMSPLRPPPIEPILKTPLNYGRLRRDAQILMLRGCDLRMNDMELRSSIKTAMNFEKSFQQLIESKKQQFKILEECFEIETKQCRSLLDECKEVLKEKHGIDTTEFENLLTTDELKAKITASLTPDTSVPPPNIRVPPPHIIVPTHFTTPPPPIGQHQFPQTAPLMRLGVHQQHPRRIPPFITPPPRLMDMKRPRTESSTPWRSRSPPTRRF